MRYLWEMGERFALQGSQGVNSKLRLVAGGGTGGTALIDCSL